MKFNLTLIDGTQLKEVYLSTSKYDCTIGEITTEENFNDWISFNQDKQMYLYGKYIQGHISCPNIIQSYEIVKDSKEDIEERINSLTYQALHINKRIKNLQDKLNSMMP